MKRILLLHYSVIYKERWGRTFPIADSLSKQGFSVVLLTTNNKRSIKLYHKISIGNVEIFAFNDIVPFRLLVKGIGLLSFISRMAYAATHRFDYVYSDCGETPNAGWPCKINQWLFDSKYISEWGDLLGRGGYYEYKPPWFKQVFGKLYLWSEFYFRRSADFIIVLSSYMREYAISRGIKREVICVVPGGAIVNILPEIEINKVNQELSEGLITLGYIGINNREILDLMPLIKVLKLNKYKRKFKLLVFGKKLSDEIIEAYDLRDVIIELGWIDYYKNFEDLRLVEIFLLLKPSSKISISGWPNKLGDYLTIGRPVMVSPYGDIIEFVNENPEGFIILESDENQIAETFDKIMEGKYNLGEMGHINRVIAENKISWEARIRSLVEFLKKHQECV